MTNQNQQPNLGQLLAGVKQIMSVASEALKQEGFEELFKGQDPLKTMENIPPHLREALDKLTKEANTFNFQDASPTEEEMDEIQKQQKAEFLKLPLEFLEAQAQNWAELVEEKKAMSNPKYVKEALLADLAVVEKDIQDLNARIPDLLIKDTRLANQAFAKLANLVNVKKEIEAELTALTK